MCNHVSTARVQKHRKEVIQDIEPMVMELFVSFERETGFRPRKVIYYRDGVSDGMFRDSLRKELKGIYSAYESLGWSDDMATLDEKTGKRKKYYPKVTFIVVQKRHHTRIFPKYSEDMEYTGNICPGFWIFIFLNFYCLLVGTVVDSGICHPFEHDFYLMSHCGVQGTSKPSHYHMLWDDNNFTADEIQQLTYQFYFVALFLKIIFLNCG